MKKLFKVFIGALLISAASMFKSVSAAVFIPRTPKSASVGLPVGEGFKWRSRNGAYCLDITCYPMPERRGVIDTECAMCKKIREISSCMRYAQAAIELSSGRLYLVAEKGYEHVAEVEFESLMLLHSCDILTSAARDGIK